MKRNDHIHTIMELSASERIFTTAQAVRLGVTRNAIAKACEAGRLQRVMHGVYRMAGVPSAETDELEAIWKLTAPPLFTHERSQIDAWDGIAVAGTSAASILGIGDFYLSPYLVIVPRRMRSRFAGVSYVARELSRDDVTYQEGFPVTRAERTLLDLALAGEDPSLVRDALRDARRKGIDEAHLSGLIDGCGITVGNRVRMTLFGEEG